MRTLIALLSAGALSAGPAGAAEATDVITMLQKCRTIGAHHYRMRMPDVSTKFEGQRTDKTHAVNGTAGALHFQCSFRADGKRITHLYFATAQGCPDDLSEADRYKYPDCE